MAAGAGHYFYKQRRLFKDAQAVGQGPAFAALDPSILITVIAYVKNSI